MAYAYESRLGYVIFFSNGPAHLTSVAGETIKMAASDADRSAGRIRVVGAIRYATAVKDELVRDGVPGLSETTVGTHYFDWHHSEADTLDKVDIDDFRKNVASLAVMSYVLADMPERLVAAPGGRGGRRGQ